jgi:hypothetical protein
MRSVFIKTGEEKLFISAISLLLIVFFNSAVCLQDSNSRILLQGKLALVQDISVPTRNVFIWQSVIASVRTTSKTKTIKNICAE